jgi:hypothetical protein
MNCDECGAILPGAETCADRFHALLAVEQTSAEAAGVHGQMVLTYHLQHPSLVKPWFLVNGYAWLRRVYRDGESWDAILRAPMAQRQADATRIKASAGTELAAGMVTSRQPDELTIADIDPAAPPGHAGRVLQWARSVYEGRVRRSA